MDAPTVISFLFFTGLVAFLTWRLTRGRLDNTEEGYFLAGRSLSGVVIAGSLLLTNLSTEQLVGLNGDAYANGLAVMAWEVIAGASLVVLALFFLPRYLKSGIATVPQFLEERYGPATRALTTFIFIVAYMLILLPFVLFLGAKGLGGMLNLEEMLGLGEVGTIWAVVVFIGVVGSAYAIFGGLRAVAVSDTFNGLGLLIGGLMITFFAFQIASGDGGVSEAFAKLKQEKPEHLRSVATDGGHYLHWSTLFTGVLLLNFFYWTTNQQIIQRTFAAKSLAEGQKGVLLASFFKILAPLILVVPGLLAWQVFANKGIDQASMEQGEVYGQLVRTVLPTWLTGFFAAVVMGSILSTFNSVLNSSATLFSLGVYKKIIRPNASQHQLVMSGRICSAVVAVLAVIAAPLIFLNVDGLFEKFQSLNGIYFIPLLAIVLFGFFNRTANGATAVITIVAGLAAMVLGTFFGGAEALDPETNKVISKGWMIDTFRSGFHYMGAVFAVLLLLQFLLSGFMKRPSPYVQQDAKVVDLTPWKHAKAVGIGLIAIVLVIYLIFAF
ncbi:MAG: solute:sodium symporter family transporter [Roseibacillus sp.]|nr:solute:sodium symporter family transporter [Roseibacillus sp.]